MVEQKTKLPESNDKHVPTSDSEGTVEAASDDDGNRSKCTNDSSSDEDSSEDDDEQGEESCSAGASKPIVTSFQWFHIGGKVHIVYEELEREVCTTVPSENKDTLRHQTSRTG